MDSDTRRDALSRFQRKSGVSADSNASRMLTYLVEETLAGRGDQIKAVSIAQDVFGRGAEFDPSRDSIVRVEMKRLRDLLAHYYETAGAEDPVRIVIPKGTYCPQFDEQIAPEPPGAPASGRSRRVLALWVGALSVGALLLVALAAVLGAVQLRAPSADPWVMDRSPRLAVMADAASSGEGLQIVRAVLPPFSNIATQIGTEEGADFILTLTTADGRLDASVTDAMDRSEVSFLSLPLSPEANLAAPVQRGVLVGWLARLAARNGVLEKRVYNTRRLEGDLRCTGLMEAYFVDQTDARHREAIACAEDVVRAQGPSFRTSIVLAYLFREEYTDQRNLRDTDPLKRAARQARTAIALNPFAAEAHYALMTVLFVSGAVSEALRAGDKAVALNPNDAEILGGYAARLNVVGQHARALSMFERAEALAPGSPGWRIYGVFLAQFATGDPDAAARTAQAFVGTTNPLYLAAKVIGCRHTGDVPCAAEARAALLRAEPDPRAMFERRSYDPALVDKLVAALE